MRFTLPGGLRLRPDDTRRALRDGALAVGGVTVAVLLLDALIFKRALPQNYEAFHTSPLWPRTLAACLGSAQEEVLYRLGLTTALVGLAALVRQRVAPAAMWTAIVLAQLALAWPTVIQFPVWGTLRFWAIGCVWGWLYWRHGWLTALAAHSSTHLILEPLLRTALLAMA